MESVSWDHQNPNPPVFSNFPASPIFDENDELVWSQLLLMSPNCEMGTCGNTFLANCEHSSCASSIDEASKSKEKAPQTTPGGTDGRRSGALPCRRNGKKDRHSKICTAQGVRDRRIRLSVEVARKFFDLQDLLGYDKASRTIEWLFNKSKKAIKELAKSHNEANSGGAKIESFLGSDYESHLGIFDVNSHVGAEHIQQKLRPPRILPKHEKNKSSVRASRDEARARARSRTREKMMMKGALETQDQTDHLHQSRSMNDYNPFAESKGMNDNQERVSPYHEKLLGEDPSTSSIACPISDYDLHSSAAADDQISSFFGFFGNWDLVSNEKTSTYYDPVPNQGSPNSMFYASPNYHFHQ